MRHILKFPAFLCLVLLSGCTPAHMNEASKKVWVPERATFPELEEVWIWTDPANGGRPGMSHVFFANEVGQIQKNARNESSVVPNFKPLAKLIKDPGFESRLKALETVTIPANYATPERGEARKKYVAEWASLEKLLTSDAKAPAITTGVESSLKNLNLYMEQMRYIPGQTPPTGDAAKKYSGVTPYEDPYKK